MTGDQTRGKTPVTRLPTRLTSTTHQRTTTRSIPNYHRSSEAIWIESKFSEKSIGEMKTVVDNKLVRTYHQEDIQQILQIAIARQAYEGEFSRQQLLEIAAELEISPESLQLAEQEWLTQQSDSQERQKFNLDRRKKLQKRFGNYGLVNIFFILLDLVSGGGLSWSLYILLSLSFLLGLDVWNKSQIQGEEYEKAFQHWKRRHQIKRSINNLLDRLLKA